MAETTKIFESHLVKQALKDSVLKLYPVYMIKNPIMFVVEVGMLLALGLTIYPDLFHQESVSRLYVFSIFIILLLTLVFANFSEALAEGRGKAQANALRQTQTEMKARRIKQDGSYEMIDASDLKKDISYVSRQVNKSQMTVKLLRASQQWMNLRLQVNLHL